MSYGANQAGNFLERSGRGSTSVSTDGSCPVASSGWISSGSATAIASGWTSSGVLHRKRSSFAEVVAETSGTGTTSGPGGKVSSSRSSVSIWV